MNAHDIRTDAPAVDGRYLGFARVETSQAREWAEPVIVTWAGDKWHSTRRILGWVGPIPPLKVVDIDGTGLGAECGAPTPSVDYDL